MNTWLLIVVTTIWTHGYFVPSVITFHEFKTQQRCEQIAKWVNTTYGKHDQRDNRPGGSNTTAQCVANGDR